MKVFLVTLLLLYIAGRDEITCTEARILPPFRYTVNRIDDRTHSLLLRRLVEEEEEEDFRSDSSNKDKEDEVPDEEGEAEAMRENEEKHPIVKDQKGQTSQSKVAETSGVLHAHINESSVEEKLHHKKNVNAESLGSKVGGNQTRIGVGQKDGRLDDVNLVRANSSATSKEEDIEEVGSDFEASEAVDQPMKLTINGENQSNSDGQGDFQEESMQSEVEAEVRGGSQVQGQMILYHTAEETGKGGVDDDLMDMREQNKTAVKQPASSSATVKKMKPKYTKKTTIKKQKEKGQHKPDKHAIKDDVKTVKGFNPDESVSNLDELENTGGTNLSHSEAESIEEAEEGWNPEVKKKLDGNVTRGAEHGKSKNNGTAPLTTKVRHKEMKKEKGAKKHTTGKTSSTESQDLDEDKEAVDGTMPDGLRREKDRNKQYGLDEEEDAAWVSKVEHKNSTTYNATNRIETLDEEQEDADNPNPDAWVELQEDNENAPLDDGSEDDVTTPSVVNSKHNQSLDEVIIKGVDNSSMALMEKEDNEQELRTEVVEMEQNATKANHTGGIEALEEKEGLDTSKEREAAGSATSYAREKPVDGPRKEGNHTGGIEALKEKEGLDTSKEREAAGSETSYAREKPVNGPRKEGNQTDQMPGAMVSTPTQGNVGYDVDEYSDFMQDFTDLPSKFQETAHQVADHLAPNVQKLTNTSKDYFNKANQHITQSFSPLVGKKMAPFFAYLISYALLLVPLLAVVCLFEHIRQFISLQQVLLFVNIYLAAYFATLLFATSVIGEPMSSFYRSSMSGYIQLQLLQALGYIVYLVLQTSDLVSACSSETLPIRLTVVLQWFVAFMIGMHYYVTVFHRAMAMKGPHTSWRIYGMYSIGFLVLCLCARIKRTKKGYHQLGVVGVDKKN